MNKSSIDNETVAISKSQRKRDARQLLELAKKLLALPPAGLHDLPLDPDLLEAVNFAHGIRSHGARKRQVQTIGKMLRQRDTGALEQAVDNLGQQHRAATARHHRVETWRDSLIAGNDRNLGVLLELCPVANVQTLRQLIRNARKESTLGKSPAAARKLFKLLREIDAEQPLPPLK